MAKNITIFIKMTQINLVSWEQKKTAIFFPVKSQWKRELGNGRLEKSKRNQIL